MQKWGLLFILVLLANPVSAQEITGYIGLNVITPAQSVEATTAVQVDNTFVNITELPGTLVASVSANYDNSTTNLQGTVDARESAQVTASAGSIFSFLKGILTWIFG